MGSLKRQTPGTCSSRCPLSRHGHSEFGNGALFLVLACRWTPELRTLPRELRRQKQTPRKSPGHSASRRCPRHLPPTMLTKLKSNRSAQSFEDLNDDGAKRFPRIYHPQLPFCCRNESKSLTIHVKFFSTKSGQIPLAFQAAGHFGSESLWICHLPVTIESGRRGATIVAGESRRDSSERSPVPK